MDSTRNVIEALEHHGCRPRAAGDGGWAALCPAHDDSHPSLSVREGDDGRVLVKCHAGCAMDEIVRACGLEPRDLFTPREPAPPPPPVVRVKSAAGVTRFEVRDAQGELRAVHVREDKPDGTKSVRWERPDGKGGLGGRKVVTLPLFGVERLRSAEPGARVLVVEGEKAAAALHERDVLAVGTVTGASSTPKDAVLADLAPFEVVLWPDNDAQGREHMARIADRLAETGAPAAGWIRWPEAPDKGDAADYLAAHADTSGLGALLTINYGELRSGSTRGPVMRRMSEIEREELRFLWEPYIPLGKLTLLEGDPGIGKSHLALRLAADLSRGHALPGDDASGGSPQSSIYVSCEDGLADTVLPRLEAMDADLDRVHALEGKRGGPQGAEVMPITLLDLAELELAIRRAEASFVVVDPVQGHLGPGVDMNSMTEVRAVLGPLRSLAERMGCAIMLVRHFRKAEAAAATHQGAGSIDFSAAARAVLQVRPDEGDPKAALMLHAKASLARVGVTRRFRLGDDGLTWAGTSTTLAADFCGKVEDRNALGEAMDFLRDELVDGRFHPSVEIYAEAKAAGLSKRSVDRARKHLGLLRRKLKVDGKSRWEMALPTKIGIKDANPGGDLGNLDPKLRSEAGDESSLWPALPDDDGEDADGEAA